MAPWSHIDGRVVLNQGPVGGLRDQRSRAVTVAIKRASSHPDFTQELPRNQREPKRAKVICAKGANVLVVVSIQKGS
jgi:hypothetical protein